MSRVQLDIHERTLKSVRSAAKGEIMRRRHRNKKGDITVGVRESNNDHIKLLEEFLSAIEDASL